MDRKLIGYLPPVLRDVREFKTVNEANEPEIALAWDMVNRVLDNQFLEAADIWGVSVWEKELKIFPKDTDTLELRKARIKAMWNLTTPYTIPWLRNWLTGLFGADKHEEKIQDYTLTIRLNQDMSEEMSRKTSELIEMLSTIIPENIWIEMENVFPVLSGRLSVISVPGPRGGQVALPQAQHELPGRKICATPLVGVIFSVTTLPMAAYEGG